MITLPEIAAEALGSFLASDMKDRFGSSHARLAELIPFAARLALECIGNSDALYHNVEHTMLVTLVGHDIFKGRALSQRATYAAPLVRVSAKGRYCSWFCSMRLFISFMNYPIGAGAGRPFEVAATASAVFAIVILPPACQRTARGPEPTGALRVHPSSNLRACNCRSGCPSARLG
jgi:hypothetical protein